MLDLLSHSYFHQAVSGTSGMYLRSICFQQLPLPWDQNLLGLLSVEHSDGMNQIPVQTTDFTSLHVIPIFILPIAETRQNAAPCHFFLPLCPQIGVKHFNSSEFWSIFVLFLLYIVSLPNFLLHVLSFPWNCELWVNYEWLNPGGDFFFLPFAYLYFAIFFFIINSVSRM